MKDQHFELQMCDSVYVIVNFVVSLQGNVQTIICHRTATVQFQAVHKIILVSRNKYKFIRQA